MAVTDRNGVFTGETTRAIKAPVVAGTTANITLAALQTIDGVTLADGDRVLVKNQTDATQNGVYNASSGNWSRATDCDSNSDWVDGTLVPIAGGTVGAGHIYVQTSTDSPVVIGTSSIAFARQDTIATGQQSATSTSSLAIGTGSKTFATQSGKAFVATQWVLAYSQSNNANAMLGQISSYTGGSLVLNVVATGGSGTISDWVLVLTNSPAAAGQQPPVGSGNVSGPGSSTAGHLATFADTTGKVLLDGGAAGSLAALSSVTPQYLANAAVAFGAGMLNGTIVESHSAGALTVAVKTLAGADPSASDPVFFTFRDATAGTGDFVVIKQTAALSLTISSGGTLGFANGIAGRLWVEAFNDAGTVRLAVINCLSGTAIYPLSGWGIASTTADDSAGGSDVAQVFYTAASHALTSCPYTVIGYLTWESGLTTAGTWDASPTRVQLYRAGVPLPGTEIQKARNGSGAALTGSTAIPYDDTIPQNGTEGTLSMSQAATANSQANIFRISHLGNYFCASAAIICVYLARDSVPDALAVVVQHTPGSHAVIKLDHEMACAGLSTAVTFKTRFGDSAGDTIGFNGDGSGNRKYGGKLASYLEVREIMS
jgi:hypothetical protein